MEKWGSYFDGGIGAGERGDDASPPFLTTPAQTPTARREFRGPARFGWWWLFMRSRRWEGREVDVMRGRPIVQRWIEGCVDAQMRVCRYRRLTSILYSAVLSDCGGSPYHAKTDRWVWRGELDCPHTALRAGKHGTFHPSPLFPSRRSAGLFPYPDRAIVGAGGQQRPVQRICE